MNFVNIGDHNYINSNAINLSTNHYGSISAPVYNTTPGGPQNIPVNINNKLSTIPESHITPGKPPTKAEPVAGALFNYAETPPPPADPMRNHPEYDHESPPPPLGWRKQLLSEARDKGKDCWACGDHIPFEQRNCSQCRRNNGKAGYRLIPLGKLYIIYVVFKKI